MLVELEPERDAVRESGLVIPRDAAVKLKRARVLALGKPAIDFRTGEERPWDYEVGQRLVLLDTVQAMAMPIDYHGRSVALINEAHVICLWTGAD